MVQQPRNWHKREWYHKEMIMNKLTRLMLLATSTVYTSFKGSWAANTVAEFF